MTTTQHHQECPGLFSFLDSVDELVENRGLDCAAELSNCSSLASQQRAFKKYFAQLKTSISSEVQQYATDQRGTKDEALRVVGERIAVWVERFARIACTGEIHQNLAMPWFAFSWLASPTLGRRLIMRGEIDANHLATAAETKTFLRKLSNELIDSIGRHLLRELDIAGECIEPTEVGRSAAPQPAPNVESRETDSSEPPIDEAGRSISQYNEDLKRLGQRCKGLVFKEQELRAKLPQLHIWEAIDHSEFLNPGDRASFFQQSLSTYKGPDRFEFIGNVIGCGSDQAYRLYKKYRAQADLQRPRRSNNPLPPKPSKPSKVRP